MAPKPRKRVEAETKEETSNTTTTTNTLLRAKDGSAFVRCDGCKKNVAVALISMHNCSLDAKIRVNLEAQVVETQTEAAKKKPVERKKAATSDEPKPKRLRKAKDEKKGATTNKPKRPLTAFFIFMNDFRKTFKEENPGSNVKDVAKQGGEKWKSLSEEEKKVYTDKAAELKAEYNKSLESNDANDEEEDVEKEAEDADDDAEEKQSDDIEDADTADENEVEKKDGDDKVEEEEEILDDY